MFPMEAIPEEDSLSESACSSEPTSAHGGDPPPPAHTCDKESWKSVVRSSAWSNKGVPPDFYQAGMNCIGEHVNRSVVQGHLKLYLSFRLYIVTLLPQNALRRDTRILIAYKW